MISFHTKPTKLYHYYVRVIWKQLPKFFQSNFRSNLRNKSDLVQVLPPLQIYRQLHLPCAFRRKDILPTLAKCWLQVSCFLPIFNMGWKYTSPYPGKSCTVSTLYGIVSYGLLTLASQHFSSLCHFILAYNHIKPVFLHRLRSHC